MALNIGTTIKQLRQELSISQEELAWAVCVSAPAVSKWETVKSYPDITLLSVIARTLETTVDSLLSYSSYISEEEMNVILEKCVDLYDTGFFEQGMGLSRECIARYPNDEELKLSLATMIPMYALRQPEKMEKQGLSQAAEWCKSATHSAKSHVKNEAFRMLSYIYLIHDEYDLAEKNIRKTLGGPYGEIDTTLAAILSKKGEIGEAEDMYQRCLFKALNECTNALTGLSGTAGKKQDYDRFLKYENTILNISSLFYGDHLFGAKVNPLLSLCHYYGKTKMEPEFTDHLKQFVDTIEHWSDTNNLSENPFFFHLTFGNNTVFSGVIGDSISDVANDLKQYQGFEKQEDIDTLINRLKFCGRAKGI